jgi:hypothetical protein
VSERKRKNKWSTKLYSIIRVIRQNELLEFISYAEFLVDWYQDKLLNCAHFVCRVRQVSMFFVDHPSDPLHHDPVGIDQWRRFVNMNKLGACLDCWWLVVQIHRDNWGMFSRITRERVCVCDRESQREKEREGREEAKCDPLHYNPTGNRAA